MKFAHLITALVLVLAGLVTNQLSHAPHPAARILPAIASPTPDDGRFTVAKVVDGDTIELDTGEKVRYIGINTPETVDPHRPTQCFGHEASEYNHNLVQGHRVELISDVSNTDKFGRLLRYVYLEDGTEVNLKLVSDGYAYAIAYPPDTAQKSALDQAQHQAQTAGRGLWSTCSTQLRHD